MDVGKLKVRVWIRESLIPKTAAIVCVPYRNQNYWQYITKLGKMPGFYEN